MLTVCGEGRWSEFRQEDIIELGSDPSDAIWLEIHENLDCDIAVVDESDLGATQEERKRRFNDEYREQQPVIIRRKGLGIDTTFSDKVRFLEKFGSVNVTVDNPALIALVGHGIVGSTVLDFVNQHMGPENAAKQLEALRGEQNTYPYSFTNFARQEWPLLSNLFEAPDCLADFVETGEVIDQFAMGSTGSGLRWHLHKQAWNSILVGQKLWLLAPHEEPPVNISQHLTSVQWFRNHQEQAPVSACVLGPGDTIYIPSRWFHATVNLGHTLSRSQRQLVHRKKSFKKWNLRTIARDVKRFVDARRRGLKAKLPRTAQRRTVRLYKVAQQAEVLMEPDFLRAACMDVHVFQQYEETVSILERTVNRYAAQLKPGKATRKPKSPEAIFSRAVESLRILLSGLGQFVRCSEPAHQTSPSSSPSSPTSLPEQQADCPSDFRAQCATFEDVYIRTALASPDIADESDYN